MKTILHTVLLRIWIVKMDHITKGNKNLETRRNSVTEELMLLHTGCIFCETFTNHIFDCFYGTFMTS